MVKVTFTLDEETVQAIRDAARRLKKPQSQIVREAVRSYEPTDRISEDERLRRLRTFETVIAQVAPRSKQEIEAEIREVRDARRRSSLHRWRRQRAREPLQ